MKTYSKGNRSVEVNKKNDNLIISYFIVGVMILQHIESRMTAAEFRNIIDFVNK